MELYTGGSYTLLSEADYDGAGQRVALTSYALGVPQTVEYVNAVDGLLVNDVTGSPTLYLYGVGLIAEYDSTWRYPLRDSNASVRQTVDATGLVISARTYKPFGESLQEEGPDENAFGFLGAQVDRVSGLLYAKGRYYDPATGRYLTPDHGQMNPYAPVQYPGAWLLLPLIGIVIAWKGRKGGPWRMLVLVCVLGVGVMLVSCSPAPTPEGPDPIPVPTIPPSIPSSKYTNITIDGRFPTHERNLVEMTLMDYNERVLKGGGQNYLQKYLDLTAIDRQWIILLTKLRLKPPRKERQRLFKIAS